MTFIDPVTPFLEPLSEVIRKLTEAEISVGRGIIINYREKEIEYELNIGLGTDASKREKLAEKVQSYFKEPFKMQRVVDFGDILLPNDFDLREKGIAKLEKGRFELDIGRLIREDKFDVASLRIVATLPDDVLDALVVPTKSSTGIRDGTRLKTRLEVSLDYASAWYKKYERFEVKNIEYFHTILVSPSTIGEVIPRDFYNKMMAAARAYHTADKKAIEFFSILNKNFLLFESEQYYGKLLGTIQTDSDAFEVVDAIPKMQHQDLLTGGPQILMPGSFKIKFKTLIRGEQLVGKAYAYIDIEKLKPIFGEMIALTNIQTRAMRFS